MLKLWLFLLIAVSNIPAQKNNVSIHHSAQLEHRNYSTSKKLVGDQNTPRSLPNARLIKNRSVVFGFLPYWIDDSYFEYIDFNLLTHIAPFSIEINPDGSVSDDHDWPWTALIDRAHSHGVRVILTATLFGDNKVKTLLESGANRSRFIKQVTEKIRIGNVDGIIVDFEGPGANDWPKLLPLFLQELKTHLHTEIPGSEVSFASPAIDWNDRWDFLEIAESCDYLFIMGYGFAGSWSDFAGPTAPINGENRNLSSMLQDTRDYGEVVQKNRKKLILGIPYYGCRWQVETAQPRSGIEEFINYPRFADTMPQSEENTVSWDPISKTPWYAYQKDGNWRQVWFENYKSLSIKYELAKNRDLLGIGIWALGYEGGERQPWKAIESAFSRYNTTSISKGDPDPETFSVESPYPNPFNLTSTIYYTVPSESYLSITLYNLLGQKIRSTNIVHTKAGRYKWDWDGKTNSNQTSASGLYFLKIRYTDIPLGKKNIVISRQLLLLP